MIPHDLSCRYSARNFGPLYVIAAVFLLIVALATTGLAQTLTRLPKDVVFSQGEASPGPVAFRHLTHIDQEHPDCTGCHPALFKMLVRAIPLAQGAAFHDEMQNGRKCGACHDGAVAFGLDDCLVCHLQE